ncbi:hypothetical protein L208DRAFT_1237167 [Tricholoma matsutake]|nr:hypothetical protein L208DRAFT_1237167 [Tricholoma matsutake 945]
MSTFLAFRNAAFSLLRLRVPHVHRPAFRAVQSSASPKSDKPLRNEQIKHRIVRLVDPVTNRLKASEPLRDLLLTLDRKKKYIELVSAEKDSIPIVKIVDQKEAFAKEKDLKLRARVAAMSNRHKEIQLTWGSTSSDMAHKLERVREELENGFKVDLVFAPKRGQILPKPAERQMQIQEIVDMMADVGREWKSRDEGRTITAIFLQGKAAAASAIEMVPKVPKKIRRKEDLKARERLKSQSTNPDANVYKQ